MAGREKSQLIDCSLLDVVDLGSEVNHSAIVSGERLLTRPDKSTIWVRLACQLSQERFGIARHTIVVAEVQPAPAAVA